MSKKLRDDKLAISDFSQYFSYITSTEYVLVSMSLIPRPLIHSLGNLKVKK